MTAEETNSVSTADLLERIGSLNAKLDAAQKDIQDLQTSDRSWVKKAGLVIGVLAGLVAIPKTVKENVEAWYDPPRTTIEWGKPLDLQYDEHDRTLQMGFPILANNDGSTNDVIQEISATLVSDHGQVPAAHVGDVQASDEGKSVLQPIPVISRVPRSLMINLRLSPPFSEQALGFEGMRTVEVVFKTHSGKLITQKYCFDIDKVQGQEVLQGRLMHLDMACE
jgi:hypothetical protein